MDINNLRIAFGRVGRNKGAPGIDGITIEVYELNLEEELKKLNHSVFTLRPIVSLSTLNPSRYLHVFKTRYKMDLVGPFLAELSSAS